MSPPKPLPSQVELREAFDFDPVAGKLKWKKSGRRRIVGAYVGMRSNRGYLVVQLNGRRYRAHRVIWKWLHGTEPPEIDHRFGDTGDNRETSIREATHALNVRNAARRKGKTLPKGVSFHKASGKFQARIRLDGRLHHLGVFDDIAAAHKAYADKAVILHGEFARLD